MPSSADNHAGAGLAHDDGPAQADASSRAPAAGPGDGVRLAELVASISLATDLANGQEPEQCLRIALLADRLCAALDAPADLRETVYWTAALRYIGCTGFAVEEARYAAGDDIGLRAGFLKADLGNPRAFAAAVLQDVGRGAAVTRRVPAILGLLTSPGAPRAHGHAQCDAAVFLATRLDMPGAVIDALAQSDERFDGRGHPRGLRGDELHPAARIVELARVAVLARHRGGESDVKRVLRTRSGGQLDPDLVRVFERDAAVLIAASDTGSPWDAFLEAEPTSTARRIEDLRPVLEVFAHYADMNGGFAHGHSLGTAALVRAAASATGAGEAEGARVALAALVHDLGRASVPAGLWDKPSRPSAGEWERIRLHAYFTQRILHRSPALRALGELASQAHERLDGAGYPRGDGAHRIRPEARLLAAADAYQACGQARAYRPALDPDATARELRAECAAGRLCRDALEAVLAAARGTRPTRPRHAGGLTEREIEVIRLLARGDSNKAIGRQLGISPRTVQRHTEHIYGKIGVNSRAGAALHAVEKGLIA